MSGDTANPRVWINADAFTAPIGTTAPTDTTSPWDNAWDSLGLLSEDGMTESRSDTTDDKYAWGGILVRTTRSKHKRQIKIAALEDNPVVWELLNPGSSAATVGGTTTRTVNVPNTDIRAFGLELIDGDVIKRRVIPRCEVIEVSDIKASDSEMEAKEFTINVYPDGDGVLYIDITDDPQAEV